MAIVYHKELTKHVQWEGHPESPFRVRTLKKKLMREGLWSDVITPVMITDNDVLKVHSAEHLARLRTHEDVLLDTDTILRPATYGCAMLSASVAATAVKLASEGVPSLAVTRPPGHHAGRNTMGGFCFLNNAAIAVEAAGKRTAIIDIDAHHGNGTEEIFYGRDDVLMIDIHESGLYTVTGDVHDTGTGRGTGYTVNIPLPAGSGNAAYEKAVCEIVVPILRQYRPELIVVSLGVDAHYCEPNTHMIMNSAGYISVCKRLIAESAEGKIAFVLEGGYHLRATAEVVAGVMAAFEGRDISYEYNEERKETDGWAAEIERIKGCLSERWKL